MKTKKTLAENLISSIINFFKGVSTSPFESDIYRIESLYNNNFKIYKTNDYSQRRQTLARLLLNDEIKNIDQLDYVTKTIDNWLGSALSDKRLFEVLKPEDNLFENRSLKIPKDFCKKFENEIKKIINDNTRHRFLIFPVRNFFEYGFIFNDRIGYLSKKYSITQVVQTSFDNSHDSIEYILKDAMKDHLFESADGFFYIITNENEGFLRTSEEELKKFVTVSLSLMKEKPSSVISSISAPFDNGMYFDDFQRKHYIDFKNPILPSVIDKKMISFNLIEVEKWFKDFKTLKQEDQERIERCLYLLNNAFCNKKTKKFNEICKGVDALLGLQGKVSKTINGNLKNILEKYNGDSLLLEKIDILWKLRNAITHGEEKEITDSRTYFKYKSKYDCCPEEDYLDLSFFCIKHCVDYFNSNAYLDYKDENKEI